MPPTTFRYSVTYDYPSPGTTRIEVRVVGGTPEDNDAEAQRMCALLTNTAWANAALLVLTGTLGRAS